MLRLSLAVLVIAVGVIVYAVAVLFAIRSENPLFKAAPALVPFAALIASLVFSLDKGSWVAELAKRGTLWLRSRPWMLHASAAFALGLAAALGVYTWQAVQAPAGVYAVQVVKQDDVPDQWVPGIPVELEQKLRPESQSLVTDRQGFVRFGVNPGDIFAIRLRRSAAPDAPVMILGDSTLQVNDKTKAGYQLVRFDSLPKEGWIALRPADPALQGVFDFAEIPASFFRWRDSLGSSAEVTDGAGAPNFPFELPPAELIVRRKPYVVGFSPLLRLPRWVAYQIVPGDPVPRARDNWLRDPAIPAASQASAQDYLSNDYDLGHLVRRSDLFGLGEAEMLKVFYMSVVVPQLSVVNRGTWLALEDYTSAMTVGGSLVFVVRGPVFEPADGALRVATNLMGSNQIPVPTAFFQVMAVVGPDGRPAVEAHLVPNQYAEGFVRGEGAMVVPAPGQSANVVRFRSTLAAVEAATGLRFDPRLHAAAEEG